MKYLQIKKSSFVPPSLQIQNQFGSERQGGLIQSVFYLTGDLGLCGLGSSIFWKLSIRFVGP